MLINTHLLRRFTTTVELQLIHYEHFGSSEKEKLHGTAPDQEEKMVN